MEILSNKILSDITIFSKYAKFKEKEFRRESWEEICDRYLDMMKTKYPSLNLSIDEYGVLLKEKEILPSMRALQFAGPAIKKNQSRIYNCFSQNTTFITSEGVKSFKDFKIDDTCYVLTHTGNFKKAIVKCYGKQNLYKYTFKKGRATKIVEVTSNHRWILKDGTNTTNLKVGDILYQAPDFISDWVWENKSPLEKLAWCYGYVYGDGTLLKNKKGDYKHSLVRLCGDQVRFLYRFEECGFESSSSMSLKGDVIVYTGKYLKTLPEVTKDNFKELLAFVIGYLDADGYKNYSKSNRQLYKGIQSSNKDSIDFIEKAFEVCSMYIMSEDNLTGQETNFGIRPFTKRFRMNHVISKYSNSMWSLVSKEEFKEDLVYCLEVEDDHSFVLSGGLVTGNCAFLPVDDYHAFSETMFLLLGGTGVGYSVQKQHVEKLPEIKHPTKEIKFLVTDSIEGWADAVKALMKAYLGYSDYKPIFDFSDIREKGARLITAGGKAPGSEPLKLCLANIEVILENKQSGEKLKPIEAHDIQCHIANAVLAGGIRRAAMISLFSKDDHEMLTCKSGNWWEKNEQRGRANNSVVLLRETTTKKEFLEIWKIIEESGAGEPGVYFTNNLDWGTNPCCEIALRPFQFCNLCEVNADDILDEEDFLQRVKVASFFGTLQAGFTDFHYLRPIWKQTTEAEALLGIGITGIGSNKLKDIDLKKAAKKALLINEITASIIKINPAARVTTIKPSGTTSCVLGTSSGIHAWHNDYYIRRQRINKNEALYTYLAINHPELLEDDYFNPSTTAIINIPQKAPEGSILRTESALDLLERVKRFNLEWVKQGHRFGDNTNNVSATVSIDKSRLYDVGVTEDGNNIIQSDEWEVVGEWMWENKDTFNGLSVLPYDNGSYIQAPFENITKEKYEELMKHLREVDLTKVIELDDNTDLQGEAACSGGNCEVPN